MKRKTYQIEEEESTLVYEEEKDERGNVVYFKFNTTEPLMENYKVFDSKNQVIEEKEFEDGIEVGHYTFEYNENGDILCNRYLVNGELFQEIKTTYHDNGHEIITIQDGVEIDKTIVEGDYQNHTTTTFENGKIIDTIIKEHNPKLNISKTNIYNDENTLMSSTLEHYINEDTIIKIQEFDNTNTQIREINYDNEGNYVISYQYRDLEDNYQVIFEFDERNNAVSKKVENENHFNSFHTCVYDDKNRIIEEEGVRDAQYGYVEYTIDNYHEYLIDSYFHFKHEYED